MRELVLFRHAKSSWDDPALDDADRPLNERGTKAAVRMGAWLHENDLIPDHVLCSTAVRTRATLTLAQSEWPGQPEIAFHDELYLATPAAILKYIQALPGDCRRAAVIGHNPGLHALCLQLIGNGPRKLMREIAMKYPTAAIAHISFQDDDWASVGTAQGRLEHFIMPRSLG